MKKTYLIVCLFICIFYALFYWSDNQDLNELKKTTESYSDLNLIIHSTCNQEVREKVAQFRFNESHEILIKCLNAGVADAHFELARTLLFELKWARRTYLSNLKRETLTPSDRTALEREVPYRGIIRFNSKDYDQILPYSRTGMIRERKEFYSEVNLACEQFDYLRLFIVELEDYLRSQSSEPENSRIANEWLRVFRSFAGKGSYKPYLEGIPSIQILKQRLTESVSIMKAIEEGTIVVE